MAIKTWCGGGGIVFFLTIILVTGKVQKDGPMSKWSWIYPLPSVFMILIIYTLLLILYLIYSKCNKTIKDTNNTKEIYYDTF